MEENDEWERCRFKKGDIVCYRDAIGTVTGVAWNWLYENRHRIGYFVVIEGDDEEDRLVADEDELVKADLSYLETGNETSLAKPAFQVGDVVAVDGQNELKVVSEVVILNTGGTAKYLYEASPFYSDGEACIYEKTLLEYQYHDTVWEEYFDAPETNDLPPWRGEIYSLYNLHRIGEEIYYSYRNDTLPPAYMEYILEGYSIDGRIRAVFVSRKNTREVSGKMNIDEDELFKTIWSIRDKISDRNSSDVDSDDIKIVYDRNKIRFTELELSIISEADRRDTRLGQARNHYPVEMADLQIMQAIQEAYISAHKVGKRKLQKFVDRRYRWWKDEKDPIRGSVLYEGISKSGLFIRFWYNLDMNLIETAYPISSGNVKKY